MTSSGVVQPLEGVSPSHASALSVALDDARSSRPSGDGPRALPVRTGARKMLGPMRRSGSDVKLPPATGAASAESFQYYEVSYCTKLL